MSSLNQTIVVELGSSRIKIGFAGESKPRCVLNGAVWESDDCSWHVPITDAMGARPCIWGKFFEYISSNESVGLKSMILSVRQWEQTLYPLFSHILTSVLFVQRPSRYRMLVLMNDMFPPNHLKDALNNVILNYLGVGGLLIVNGGGFATIPFLLDALPPTINASSQPKAHLLVDIGTYEARVVVSVTGSLILEGTYQTTMSGYHSFLTKILHNYQLEDQNNPDKKSITTLEDANSVLQTWLSLSAGSADVTILSVDIPSLQTESEKISVELPLEPLQKAFHQTYLDYTNPSSLIYAILTCAIKCPIDYKRIALQNVLLLGGGSTTLRFFQHTYGNCDGEEFEHILVKAAHEACGLNEKVENEASEEKKEDNAGTISSISKQRFRCLAKAVSSILDESTENKCGISVSYTDPFPADTAAWIGGSIMGSLELKHKEWMSKSSKSTR